MDSGDTELDPTLVLAAHWSESERRLYPVATTSPDAYKAAVTLVRAVADALADVETLDGLARRWDRSSQVLAEALQAYGAAVGAGVGEAAAAGAGFALRRRELLAERAERRRRESIAAARRQGSAWAVIHEQGDLDAGLADPYQCVELHLGTGLAVVAAVAPDPATMAPSYAVSVMAFCDGDAGAAPVDPAALGDRETGDRARFEQDRREIRRLVETARG